VYQEDEFAMRWMLAFDEVIAPCISSIDNIEHYFDPDLAPADFVEMLAWWIGVELDETWSEQSRRSLVSEAASLYRVRGTVAGMKRHVAIYTGVEPEIEESGGCAVSETSGGALPGSDRPFLLVRVRVGDPASIDERRLSRLVASSKPAHLPHRVEVLGFDQVAEELPPDSSPAGHITPLAAGDDLTDRLTLGYDSAGTTTVRQPAEPGEGPAVVELSGVTAPEPSVEDEQIQSLLPPEPEPPEDPVA
jgi:phage tail-like protein